MPGDDLLRDPEAMVQFLTLLNGQPVTLELVAEVRRILEEDTPSARDSSEGGMVGPSALACGDRCGSHV
jgi:hypothetical protein